MTRDKKAFLAAILFLLVVLYLMAVWHGTHRRRLLPDAVIAIA